MALFVGGVAVASRGELTGGVHGKNQRIGVKGNSVVDDTCGVRMWALAKSLGR